jgi:hypothetical protein
MLYVHSPRSQSRSNGSSQATASFFCRFLFAALPVLFLLAFSSAHAQFSARLTGTVADTTGAVVPGATVTLVNNATQTRSVAQTSGGGTFQFNELPPGTYSVTVFFKGFQQNSEANIAIVAETPRNLNVTLQPGKEDQTVTVDASTIPILQTSDASIGSTVTSDQIQRLPTFGADPYELLRTAPGITGDGARSGTGSAILLPNGSGPGGSNSGIFQTENQVQISAAGQRVEDNTYTLDGVSVDSLTHGGAAVVTPNEEAVSAITIVSTSYDAGDGRNSGAQIKVVSKSGTNNIHGSLFFLYDEPGLNAFNKYGGPAPGTLRVKDLNKQRTWAASLGGPIIKNKLFLFTSFEEFKSSQNSFTTSYVETPQYRAAIQAQRSGGVSEGIIASPGSQPRIISLLANSCAGFTAGTCNVVTGGIDIGSLTPGGTSQIGAFPSSTAIPGAPYNGASPQQVGGGLDGVPDLENVQLSVPMHGRGNQYNARVDWQATPKDLVATSLFFTKLDNLGTSGTAGSRPDADLPFKPLNSAETIIWIHTFSASWLNEARVNGTRFAENGIKDAGNTVDFGIPYDNVQNYPFALQYGVNQASTSPAVFAENTYEGRDTVTHSFGAHNLRMGVEARIEQDNDNLNGDQRPVFAFNGLWAFSNDASVFEQVQANSTNGGTPNTARYFRSQDYAAFIQHDWKVKPNFTLNAGLRYELFTPLRNKGFQVNEPELGPAGNVLAGTTLQLVNYMWHFQPRNISPKIGFAWSPAIFHDRTVIRGGYSLAYNHLDTALFNNEVQDGPNNFLYFLCCASAASGPNSAGVKYQRGSSTSPSSFAPNPVLANGVGANGFPNSYTYPGTTNTITPSVELYGADPNLKYPSTDLYSLEIQQNLGGKFTGTIGYSGSTGRHYARLVDQDFLYTTTGAPFGDYFRAQTDSIENYNALNTQLRRTGKNLTVSFVYTYAKSLDQLSNGDGSDSNANQTNPANNASEYGPSDYNLKHRVVATAIYTTPSVHTHSELVKALANGWQINGTYTYHTGFPWTPVTGNFNSVPAVAGAGTINPTRPVSYNGQGGTSCSTNAFETGSNFPNRSAANPGGGNYFGTIAPPSGVYKPGIGRNSFEGPCYQDVDMSFAKQVEHDFGGHHTLLRFQANMYNIFNILQLQPLTNGNANGGSNIENQYFGYSQAADAGRVIEFLARVQF